MSFREQKPFDAYLNLTYDQKGKVFLKDFLGSQSYSNIFLRENDFTDGDESFWDVRAEKENKQVYFDVEVKELWKKGNDIPKHFIEEGVDIPNRKSIAHNEWQTKVNFLVVMSVDGNGAFVVKKSVFESAEPFYKYTKITGTQDKFRRISLSSGLIFIKKDGTWQKRS